MESGGNIQNEVFSKESLIFSTIQGSREFTMVKRKGRDRLLFSFRRKYLLGGMEKVKPKEIPKDTTLHLLLEWDCLWSLRGTVRRNVISEELLVPEDQYKTLFLGALQLCKSGCVLSSLTAVLESGVPGNYEDVERQK